ncbi:MAG: Flp family type IVb pilin [Acidimicrobiia bacterium]|jgi:Flp pilus assembly pilin Flp
MSVYISIRNLLATRADDDQGASIVEYALLVSLIALVALVAIAAFGTQLSSSYSGIAESLP